MTLQKELDALDSFYLERIQQTSTPENGDFKLYPPTKCNPKYIILQCECGRRVVPSTCMNLDCKNCADFVTRRRQSKVVHRLLDYIFYWYKSHVKRAVLYTVLTVPPEVRYKYSTREAWAKLRRRAWKMLKKEFAGHFGIEATHPVGDKDKKHFHPHLNFLWKQKTGFRPFIDVDRLRTAWAQILEVQNVDVHHEYTHRIGKVIHWVRYVVRTFPGTHKWTGPVRWFGKYPKSSLDKHHHTCPDCGQRTKYIGWLLADTVDHWYQYGQPRGMDPPWERGDFKT